MSFFGNLKSEHSLPQPARKPEKVVHPQNAPRTIGEGNFPEDFTSYKYAGASLELIDQKDSSTGQMTRRPALVAAMVREGVVDGVEMREDMTASISDLRSYREPGTNRLGHPEAASIAAALDSYYENKIAPAHQEAAKMQAPQSRPQADMKGAQDARSMRKLGSPSGMFS